MPTSMRSKRAVRAQPLIAVRDVRSSAAWYSRLLGVEPMGGDHGDVYEQLLSDEAPILQLHAWDEEEQPSVVDGDAAALGHGVLLWFECDDFDAVSARARELRAEVVEEPHVNPNTGTAEFSLRDPDGYYVTISALDAA